MPLELAISQAPTTVPLLAGLAFEPNLTRSGSRHVARIQPVPDVYWRIGAVLGGQYLASGQPTQTFTRRAMMDRLGMQSGGKQNRAMDRDLRDIGTVPIYGMLYDPTTDSITAWHGPVAMTEMTQQRGREPVWTAVLNPGIVRALDAGKFVNMPYLAASMSGLAWQVWSQVWIAPGRYLFMGPVHRQRSTMKPLAIKTIEQLGFGTYLWRRHWPEAVEAARALHGVGPPDAKLDVRIDGGRVDFRIRTSRALSRTSRALISVLPARSKHESGHSGSYPTESRTIGGAVALAASGVGARAPRRCEFCDDLLAVTETTYHETCRRIWGGLCTVCGLPMTEAERDGGNFTDHEACFVPDIKKCKVCGTEDAAGWSMEGGVNGGWWCDKCMRDSMMAARARPSPNGVVVVQRASEPDYYRQVGEDEYDAIN